MAFNILLTTLLLSLPIVALTSPVGARAARNSLSRARASAKRSIAVCERGVGTEDMFGVVGVSFGDG